MITTELLNEFEYQKNVLLSKQYPKLANLPTEKFLNYIDPLKKLLDNIDETTANSEQGYLPFCIVISHTLVKTTDAMTHIERNGKLGITKLTPLKPENFHSIESLTIPDVPAYLLVDIDRGKEYLNIRPHDAFIRIHDTYRSPLTIDEGVAIVTQHPEFLMKNNCFSLLGSRHPGDKRVPAIWINAKQQPNLGWCWDGNPHTWLGSASCKTRLS